MTNQTSTPKKTIMLFDSSGEHDEKVTPAFMSGHGLDFISEPFSPLTEREKSLMCSGIGIPIGGDGGWFRYVRMTLVDGVKHIEFSDDDSTMGDSSTESSERVNKNHNKAKELFNALNERFGAVILSDEPTFEDGKCTEYFLDGVMPLSYFDGIADGEALTILLNKELKLTMNGSTNDITPQMRINSVCEQRGVPAIKVGQPCIVDGKKGLIINGNSSANFNVRFAESGQVSNCHPYWKMKILSMNRQETVFEHKD